MTVSNACPTVTVSASGGQLLQLGIGKEFIRIDLKPIVGFKCGGWISKKTNNHVCFCVFVSPSSFAISSISNAMEMYIHAKRVWVMRILTVLGKSNIMMLMTIVLSLLICSHTDDIHIDINIKGQLS